MRADRKFYSAIVYYLSKCKHAFCGGVIFIFWVTHKQNDEKLLHTSSTDRWLHFIRERQRCCSSGYFQVGNTERTNGNRRTEVKASSIELIWVSPITNSFIFSSDVILIRHRTALIYHSHLDLRYGYSITFIYARFCSWSSTLFVILHCACDCIRWHLIWRHMSKWWIETSKL